MDIDVVLFDLGGVLIEYRGVAAMAELSGITDEEDLWRRWLECRWVRAFERGGCSPEDFAAGVIDDWALSIDTATFVERFAGWIGDALPGAPELVAEVAAAVRVGCLSNTNAVHWAQRERWPFVDDLHECFLSFELGLVKPDRALFDRVVDELRVDADRVLFLDDNAINVDGARAAGLRAERARGVEEARVALVAAAVLS